MAVYSIEGCQDSCYPGTTVLVNRLGLTEQKLLTEAESIIVTSCSAKAEKELAFGTPDLGFYKSLHRTLFGDLYDWAGTFRTINISKKGTVFCDHDELERLGELKFAYLKEHDYLRGLADGSFFDELAELYHDMNMLHPFREGNGRTLRLFMTLLVRNTSRDIDFSLCETDMLTIAAMKAAQGDISVLRDVLREIIF